MNQHVEMEGMTGIVEILAAIFSSISYSKLYSLAPMWLSITEPFL